MNMKRWLLWACIIALLAGEFFLFSANRQKEAVQAELRASRHETEQLQTQLEQLKIAGATAQSSANSLLRNENEKFSQDALQKQKENDQLREQNRQLALQLNAAHDVAQQQQEQLQQMQTENQPAAASGQAEQQEAEPVPLEIAQRNACINNLRQIDAAKQQWALENNKTASAIPTMQDLLPFLKDGIFPVCPSGGVYTIGAVGDPPTCSTPGHVLP